ncbi:hypothetical protein CHGG_07722 [Chaetomium globosum CBS 148.51]|uniref:Spindle pole body-associated protein cut12 domain-containing protein n=1 Tax=Chaetomium globosum (strain ATCC 6205 / CBS 148.51 / DSM 1962 / NBRC 6347 / NRRL 1970) TaxID=306901 RepID=Q2GWD2_CHAGB|nr:uncharacterized protein CHGG_07722 [Chaetomium globosum CBS 148.51]EAQ86469.1 hypothetical protein CHGG_07722 [Chaetomium globosum CBS 148.51]
MISWALKRNSDNSRDAPVSDDTTQIDIPDTPAPLRIAGPRRRQRRTMTAQQNVNSVPAADRSPTKPAGILLTPGTGTTRRKRVSFGNDVKQGSGGTARTSATGLPDECPGKFPSPWVDRNGDEAQPRPKTRLQQAMENSRKANTKDGGTEEKDFAHAAKEPEDAWEEVEDDESDFDGDVTTDLNEPHSRSGKYWKSYFETYHSDAKMEMEKLVKYKHLAKSYAKMKDTEALELNQKLKEEQGKVKSWSLCLISRTMLMDANDNNEQHHPRTQRTLMETQRELRRARSQVRELEKLQEERDRLRSDLKFAEQRASKLAEENRKLSRELSQTTSRTQDLEKMLEDSKGSYEKLKDDAKSRYVEAQQVLQKKNEKISELQELDSLKREGAEPRQPTRSTRAKSFDEKLVPTERESARVLSKDVNGLKQKPSEKAATSSTALAETRQREKRSRDDLNKRASHDDATLAQARALREKLEAEFGTKGLPTSTVFGDRGNLQDSHGSASSGHSAHSREGRSYPSRTDRPSRAARPASTSLGKVTLGDLPTESRDKRARKSSLEQMRQVPVRPLSRGSESDTSPDVGGANAQTSAVWSTMNASRTALPEHRKAAALARIQRRIAERKMLQQAGRDKENARP